MGTIFAKVFDSVTALFAAANPFTVVTNGWENQPLWQAGISLLLLLSVAIACDLIIKQIILRIIRRISARFVGDLDAKRIGAIAARLSHVLPALIVQMGIGLIPHFSPVAADLVIDVCTAIVVLALAMALSATLELINDIYQRGPHAANRPIKGYVQIGKIAVYCAALILIIAEWADRSPWLLLSGLGAMAAVLLLVFKDTILSLVASVQLGTNDMLRIGDWIEMPQLNADGDVIDIALHTVKVQNFDKTITTIPTHRLINESYRNWRGMRDAGGRRIKRSLLLDQNSIDFLDADAIARLSRFGLLTDYLTSKLTEVTEWNSANNRHEPINSRRLTNIGTFRSYVMAYLRARPDVSNEMTMLVRHLAPTENGLPSEVYAFTTSTVWADFESTQADIFDHLIAILPEFGLRLFQSPSGADMALALSAAAQPPAVN